MMARVDWTIISRRVFGIFWLLMDQGIFAVSNFVMNVLFARWLSPADYGWFALSFSGCQFIAMLHNSAIQEPLLVQSANVQSVRRRAYINSLFRIHVIIFLAALGLGIAGWMIAVGAFDNVNLGWVILGSLVGAAAMLTNIIGRRLCYIFISARTSAIVGMIYLLGSLLSGLIVHWVAASVWWFDLWLIIGGWSLFGSLATFWLVHRCAVGDEVYPISEIISFGRKYAHWGFASAFFGWMRYDGLFVILAHYAGLSVVAQTRAIFNLGSPLLQANMAIQTFALVSFSADNSRGTKQNVWRILIGYAALAAVALVFIQIVAAHVVNWFYDGRYLDGAWQLPLYCLSLSLLMLDSLISSMFKAKGMLSNGYASIFVTGSASILLGFLLIPQHYAMVWVVLSTSAIGLSTALLLHIRTNTSSQRADIMTNAQL